MKVYKDDINEIAFNKGYVSSFISVQNETDMWDLIDKTMDKELDKEED